LWRSNIIVFLLFFEGGAGVIPSAITPILPNFTSERAVIITQVNQFLQDPPQPRDLGFKCVDTVGGIY
jgi:hypothetical protein